MIPARTTTHNDGVVALFVFDGWYRELVEGMKLFGNICV
jgi:hypothetical protein